MTKITVNDFVDVLCLRNQLLNVDNEKLLEVYQDYENYITFVASVLLLKEIDDAFLLYRASFISKINNVVQIHRYDAKDIEIRKAANDIVGYLNHIKMFSSKERRNIQDKYHDYNEKVRQIEFPDSESLLYALGYDAVVYTGIVEGDMDRVTEDDMFLSSINYFLEEIPTIFNDPDVQKRTLERIDEIGKGFSLFNRTTKKYSKITKDNYQKKKLKEE